MSTSTAVKEIAELISKFLEGISTGKILLKDAREFVNSERMGHSQISEALKIPTLGSIHYFPCPNCEEEASTPHVVTREPSSLTTPSKPDVIRFACQRCHLRGPVICYIENAR